MRIFQSDTLVNSGFLSYGYLIVFIRQKMTCDNLRMVSFKGHVN